MEGFLRYRFGGLIFGGAYTWRGLFSELYGISEGFLKFCNLISNLILGQIIDSNPTNVHKLAA